MKTAAAFAKGFLELEGELTPILVSLVSKESSKNNSVMMLDPSGNKDITKDMEHRCLSPPVLSQVCLSHYLFIFLVIPSCSVRGSRFFFFFSFFFAPCFLFSNYCVARRVLVVV